MSRLLVTSDIHLGHSNIHKYRTNFSTAEEHHETLFDNLATEVRKRDSLLLLGDICFTKEWLVRLDEIKCVKKTLILGNHDTERVSIRDLVKHYDAIHSLYSKRNYWWSHAPIHPQEMRGRVANIHGHLHGNMVWQDEVEVEMPFGGSSYYSPVDTRYLNACVEHTDWKPINFKELTDGY